MKQCIKCDQPMNNPLSGLCVNHLEVIRVERMNKHMAYIKRLQERGPVCEPDDCNHETVDFSHCFDCGEDSEEYVCGHCKEWTDTLNPCC
jgi:hypothetical protein